MFLDARLRRLTTYLYLQDLYRGKVVLELDPLDVRSAQFLVEHGARQVVAVGPRLAALEQSGIRTRPGEPSRTAEPAAGFDLVVALEVADGALDGVIAEACRVLKSDGTLVLGMPSADRPGAGGGLSYYDLVDRLEPKFPSVRMIGQAPFAGATLVQYGVADPEPVLDGTLVPKGERVQWYVALAGPSGSSCGYGVVQLPLEGAEASGSAARAGEGELHELRRQLAELQRSPAPERGRRAAGPPPPPVGGEVQELRAQLRDREQGMQELRDAAVVFGRKLEELRAELRERDAHAAELERESRELGRLHEAVRLAEARAAAAEGSERDTRRRLAEAEGTVLRLRAGGGAPIAGAPAPSDRLAALEAENEKLRVREEEARQESWRHMKARSDAEAAAAEVREDTVRKLKDARKLASVELMRAMEEATKKAVTLREDLVRTERERKELKAELAAASEELARLRAGGAAAPSDPGPADLDVDARRERIALLRRELEDAERRAAARAALAAAVGEQLAGVESALRGEEQRLLAMEEAIRRAARALGRGGGAPSEP